MGIPESMRLVCDPVAHVNDGNVHYRSRRVRVKHVGKLVCIALTVHSYSQLKRSALIAVLWSFSLLVASTHSVRWRKSALSLMAKALPFVVPTLCRWKLAPCAGKVQSQLQLPWFARRLPLRRASA